MKYLGVDPGGRRFGLAFADSDISLVFPIGVFPYDGVQETASTLHLVARERGAEKIILGLPTTESGEETGGCRRTRALADALADLGSTVAFQPEFLTTREAKARARDLGRPGTAPVDDLAAQIILEDFLAASSGNNGRHR